MPKFYVEAVQMDLMHPEAFEYRVFTKDGDKFVAGFPHLDEANDFIVENGGEPQEVRLWRKGIQATAGSTYR